MKKRLLSIFMAVSMLFTALPVSAEDTALETADNEIVQTADDETLSDLNDEADNQEVNEQPEDEEVLTPEQPEEEETKKEADDSDKSEEEVKSTETETANVSETANNSSNSDENNDIKEETEYISETWDESSDNEKKDDDTDSAENNADEDIETGIMRIAEDIVAAVAEDGEQKANVLYTVEPGNADSYDVTVPISIQSEDGVKLFDSYNLHVWLSDTAYGETPNKVWRMGDPMYVNYEVINLSGGSPQGCNYSAKMDIYNNSTTGYFDFNSYRGYKGVYANYTGSWGAGVVLSGDLDISVGISWHVYDTVPTITTQPITQTVSSGDLATFSVTATGTNLKYQWYYAASASGSERTEISGATSSSYSVSASSSNSGRYYFCKVHNYGNSIYSSRVQLNTVYTISYNANGGSGAPSSQTKNHGTDLTLANGVPTRFPYTFKGWGNSSTSTSTSYCPNGTYANNGNRTFFAVWENAETLTGASENTDSTNMTFGGILKYYKYVPTKTASYTFYTKGSNDTYGYLYDSSGKQLTYNDDGGEGNNCKITYELTAGTTYYFAVKFYSSSKTGTIEAHLDCDTVTITFNGNGATSGGPGAITKTRDVDVTLPMTGLPRRIGYTFLGWATNSNSTTVEYIPKGTYSGNQDVTLYAIWKPADIIKSGDDFSGNATFNFFGTSNEWYWLEFTPTVTAKYTFYSVESTGKDVSGCLLNSSGNIIVSDYYESNNHTGNFKITETLTSGTKYFYWIRVRKSARDIVPIIIPFRLQRECNITYAANGGSGAPAGETALYRDNYTISNTVPTRSGYSFLGWSTSSTATSPEYYSGGTMQVVNANTILYAVWGKNTYTVNFKYGVNYTSGFRRTVNAGSEVNLSANSRITNGGYTILGWNTIENASTALTSYIPTGDVTLYAVQQKVPGTKIEIGQASGRIGKTVEIPVYASDLSAKSLDFSIIYDKSKLSLISATGTSATNNKNFGMTITNAGTTGGIGRFSWYNSMDVSFSSRTHIATIKFDILSDADVGSELHLKFFGSSQYYRNSSYPNYITFAEEIPGKITVLGAGNTITYDYATNGGTSATKAMETIDTGARADLTPTAAKEGYEFVGWNTNRNATEGLVTYTPSGNTTLYAIYKKTYKVKLHRQSSIFTDEAEVYNTNTLASYTVPAPPEIAGMTAQGWRIDSAAKVRQYAAGNTISISGDTDLYAVYRRVLTLSYNSNGGTAAPIAQSVSQYYNASGEAESKTFTLAAGTEKRNYSFSKWAVGSETGAGYNARENISINGDTIVYAVYNALSKTAVPTAKEENITSGKSVTLESADQEARIYYTTDGSVPNELSKVYSMPITIVSAGNTTIKAIAVRSGMADSDILTKIVNVESAGQVSSSVPTGMISAGTRATLTNSNNAKIFYTTSGSDPNERSAEYSDPIVINEPTVLKAIAVKEGYANSEIFTFTYNIKGKVSPVNIEITNILNGKSAAMSCETDGVSIYYTTDGSEPTEASQLYTGIIEFTREESYQIKAIAVLAGYDNSPVAYNTISVRKASAPVPSIEAGEVEDGSKVRLSTNEDDAKIYYTTDGSEPNLNSSVYENEFEISENVTIKAITAKDGLAISDTAVFSYTLRAVTADPEIVVENDKGVKTVTMSCETDGAVIYYTTDGTTPSLGKAEYSTPLVLNRAGKYTIKAIAVKAGNVDSKIKTVEFEIKKSSPPVSNQPDGEKTNGTLITLSANGDIYYTINGRDLTQYNAPIKLNESMEIKAYAIEDNCLPSDEVTFNYTVQRITSGTDGAITWEFSNRGELVLYGNSSIRDYDKGETPWYPLRAEITKVIIDEGITGIGKNAFDGLYNVEQTIIPDTVGAIGESAFEGCEKLSSIDFSDKLSGISNKAFKDCKGLTKIIVPVNVRRIGQGAFEGCTVLRDLTVPFVGGAGVTTEPDEVFSYIFNGSVPESLKNVMITNETLIPANAFKNLGNIESIIVNNSVSTIGANAFEGCSSLRGFNIPAGVSRIEEATFKDCFKAETITVPDSVQYIGTKSFENCEKLKQVNIPNGVTALYDDTFKNCSSLTNITVPDSVLNAGTGIFNGCSSINTIKLPFVGANANAGSVGNPVEEGVFGYWFGTSDNGIEQAGVKYAVPNSIKNVEITNPSSGTNIPSSAFINCDLIETIKINNGRQVGNDVFKNCASLKSLILPNSISQSIGSDILSGCGKLEELTIPFIGYSRSSNKNDKAVLGYFFGKSTGVGGGTEQSYSESQSAIYNIPNSLIKVNVTNATTIPFGAFQNCDYVEEVNINTSGTVDQWAFFNCRKLEKIKLPTDLNIIEKEAFANCVELSSVNIPNNAKRIGDNAFYGDYKLSQIVIPKSVTEIDINAFAEAINTVIYCYKNSFAHNYAETNNIEFKLLDEGDTELIDIDLEKEIVNGKVEYILNTGNNDTAYGMAYIAEYDEKGALVNVVQEICIGGGKHRIKTNKAENSAVVEIKAFIWNPDNMMPLSKSISIE